MLLNCKCFFLHYILILTFFLYTSYFYIIIEVTLCFVCSESTAAKRQLHGGVGGRSEEATTRFPLHRPAALCQAQETDRRVSENTS